EDLVLADAKAPATYDFTVELSPGLTARETAEGGITFVDASGSVWAAFAPPTIADASKTPSPPNPMSPPVSLRIAATSPQLVVRLAVDPTYVADPARVWPVTVDPTILRSNGGGITSIANWVPNNNYGTISDAALWGGGTNVERILYQPSTSFADYFTDPVDIQSATVDLYAKDNTTGQPVQPVGAHEITADWTDTQATWNQRQAGVAWATPGGDFSAQPTGVNANITGAPNYRYWPVTSAVRAWVQGERPQRGVVLKYENEATGPLIYFSRLGTFSYPTRYEVLWEPLEALRDPYRYEHFRLGPNRQASVNVASGTLDLRERDLQVTGTGLDAAFDRSYDSRYTGLGSMGMRWF
ncbi:MAG: DNRLRE domain-containing protein, partial [Actinobacteria bacterium]|nr:DNRLRE domain-containing protein [Actinomycetota bacterium]